MLDRQREDASEDPYRDEDMAESKRGAKEVGNGHAPRDNYQEDEYYQSSYGNCLSSGSCLNSCHDHTEQIITDPDGLQFWVGAFGHGTFQVPWDIFVSKILQIAIHNKNLLFTIRPHPVLKWIDLKKRIEEIERKLK